MKLNKSKNAKNAAGGKIRSVKKTDAGKTKTFQATVRANPQGFAFLVPDGKKVRECDFFVPKRKLGDALDGDVVLAEHVKGTKDEAKILKIVSRGRRTVTGRFERDKNFGYVLPDDEAYLSDVLVPLNLCGGAKSGDKVVAEIVNYPENAMVEGKIIEILGRDGDLLSEELAIIRTSELREEFPPYVEETAQKIASVSIKLDGRRDFRNIPTITIDGADTRDIDDAVSLEERDGKYVLGVHIADVADYVKYNGCIDKEASARGTSVYFPDRVLPMLPRALSNGACSLNEGEERYALSCLMTFDKSGKRISYEICESVIKSDRRTTYDEVTEILENGAKADRDYPEIAPMLRSMAKLTHLLEKARTDKGEVNLDVKEAHIYLDEAKSIIIPDVGERALSYRMIEQFMVSANEAVAEFLEKRKAPCLFRVHEKPAPEKAALFFSFVKDFGINTTADADDAEPRDFQKILRAAEGKPFSSVINMVALRSMQKARYDDENLGHFGLASKCYCHFTSPIRRYPDLFVHRVLKLLLREKSAEVCETYAKISERTARDASEKERRAELAERNVDDLYKIFYMDKHMGEEFDAVISGVVESGIFCRLKSTIEGVVRLENLPQDKYEFIENKFTLKGKRRSFKLGDEVRVKVAGCDLGTRRVQFLLV